eukprot:3392508-Karenia_brevis.AAC.1
MAAGVEEALPTQRSSVGPSATAGHALPVLSLGLMDADDFAASEVSTLRMVHILEVHRPLAPEHINDEAVKELIMFMIRLSVYEMAGPSTRLKELNSQELAFLHGY